MIYREVVGVCLSPATGTLEIPDNGEKFVVEMSNATLTTIAGYQAQDADLTITIDRRDLEHVMIGSSKFADKVAAGKPKMA